MATRSHPIPTRLDAPTLLDELLPLLREGTGDGPLVVGIEPVGPNLELHAAPLPHDGRAAAAGLFGMRAGDSWCAVAAALAGRARDLASHELVGTADVVVVVDRDGGTSSRLRLDDRTVGGDEDAPEGLTVDALHRVMGLPSPGGPPPAALAALAVWNQLVVEHALEHRSTSWSEAAALHPGGPRRRIHRTVAPSVETVVEATLRLEGTVDWARLHRGACRGRGPADLSAAEARWMDPTLYARWVLGGLPDPDLAADVLRSHGDAETADRLLEVADAVLERLRRVNTG